MNEKIRALAEQAGQGKPFHIPPQFVAKFAELIVKECIMLCEEWIEIDKDLKETKSWVGVDPEIGPEFCIGSIKNHFGVEE